MRPTIHDAIRLICPQAVTIWGHDEIIVLDQDGNKIGIDLQSAQNKLEELLNQYPNNEYQQQRAAAYPSIADQLDMIWHTIDQGATLDKQSDFYKSIASIKSNFPKE